MCGANPEIKNKMGRSASDEGHLLGHSAVEIEIKQYSEKLTEKILRMMFMSLICPVDDGQGEKEGKGKEAGNVATKKGKEKNKNKKEDECATRKGKSTGRGEDGREGKKKMNGADDEGKEGEKEDETSDHEEIKTHPLRPPGRPRCRCCT